MSKYASKLDELNAYIAEHFPNLRQQLEGANKRKRVMVLNKFCNLRLDHNANPEIAIPKYLAYLQLLAQPVISNQVKQCDSPFKTELKIACMHCYRSYPRSELVTVTRHNGPRLVCKGCMSKHNIAKSA